MSNIKILTTECIEVKGGLGILAVVYIFQSVLHHTIDVSTHRQFKLKSFVYL